MKLKQTVSHLPLFYFTLLAVTTFVWGWIFYRKDYHPQPLAIIFKSFVAGMFSMLPLYFYRYAYEHFVPRIASYEIFRPLLDSFILSGVFYFLLNLLTLFTLLTVTTGLLTCALMFFKHEVLQNIRASLRAEELEFISVSLMIGGLIYFEKFFETALSVPVVTTLLGGLLFLTVIEEYVKHLMVRFIDDKRIMDVDDAITLSIVVGLAFALIETVVYAMGANDWGLLLPRSLMSMPVHLVSSGIFGYYYGLAHFAKPILKADKSEKTYSLKAAGLFGGLSVQRSALYGQKKIVQGLAFATLYHAAANLLFEVNLAFAVIPLITFGLILLSRLYKQSRILYRLLPVVR